MNFPEEVIQAVWDKATTTKEFHPAIMRKDRLGAIIIRTHYSNPASPYGWDIDYIDPDKKGSKEVLANLEPLQWENKSLKSGGEFIGEVTAKHLTNTRIK